MTLAGLRSRAARRRAHVSVKAGRYTLADALTSDVLAVVDELTELEDAIAWLDDPAREDASALTGHSLGVFG